MGNYVQQEYTCQNSDINFKGRDLGYDWNTICDWISTEGIYGEDGCGYTFINHSKSGESSVSNKDLQVIIDALLDEVGIEYLKVLDD